MSFDLPQESPAPGTRFTYAKSITGSYIFIINLVPRVRYIIIKEGTLGTRLMSKEWEPGNKVT